MNIITLPSHTIVTLIGPSLSGKSTFAESLARSIRSGQLIGTEDTSDKTVVCPTVKVISSDHIRRQLLGDSNADRHDDRMMYASEQAFRLLFEELDAFTTWPISTNLVLVDTTGLDDRFRQQVRDYAERNGYHSAGIVLNYKDTSDYFTYTETEFQRSIVRRHVSKLKKSMRALTGERYTAGLTKIASLSELATTTVRIDENDLNLLHRCRIPSGTKPFVIGDVHGCYNELLALLTKAGYSFDEEGTLLHSEGIENVPLVFVGDVIDKGPQTLEVINLVYNLIQQKAAYIILGNHENFVYKYLKGIIKRIPAGLESYFDSIPLLEKDEELRERFYFIYENSLPFVSGQHFIATHTPCEKKYLGKVTQWGLKAQRQLRYARRQDFSNTEEGQIAYKLALQKDFAHLERDSVFNAPYHLFGHVPQPDILEIGNKLGIDTDAINGGRLTGIFINGFRSKFIQSVASEQENTEETPPWIKEPRRRSGSRALYNHLEDKQQLRIKWLSKNSVNFISGTMSPADKRTILGDTVNESTVELESLQAGFDYFKSNGVNKVIIQPKHMGSRANVYLFHPDHGGAESSYVTSRNGYLITEKLSETQTKQLQTEFNLLSSRLFNIERYKKAKLLILDAELMPWRVLGEGLIDNQFYTVYNGYQNEVEFLNETGFYSQLDSLINDPVFEAFKTDWGGSRDSEQEALGKKGLKKKYNKRDYERFSNLMAYLPQHKTYKEVSTGLNDYKTQLDLHGADSSLEIRPFCILKAVFTDGSESIDAEELTTTEHWELLNEQMYSASTFAWVGFPPDEPFEEFAFSVDLEDENAIAYTHQYFESLRAENLEGIVMKPDVLIKGVAPYLKVRTPEYLTLAYGPDYRTPNKYQRLVDKKHIGRKLSLSITEWDLGMEMLRIPYDSLVEGDIKFLDAAASMIATVQKEQTLDPRL